MARVNAPLLAFNRGEVSKHALARIDLAKMALATQVQVNWMPTVLGRTGLRPGLFYVGGIAGDNRCELIDFVYAKDDTAVIELTDSLMRVWINDALISRPAVATTVSDPTFAGGGTWSTADTTSGCTATITGGVATLTASARGGLARIKQTLTVAGGDQNKEHGLRLVISNGPVIVRAGSSAGLADYIAQTVLDTGTHSIAFTPTGGSVFLQIDSSDARAKTLTSVSIDPAGVLTLPTPWAVATLPSLRWTQSLDVLYIAQYGGQQYKIERRGTRPGARGWSVVKYRSDNGPFFEAASIDANLTPSVYAGNGTLASDRSYFTASHVAALFRLFSPGQVNQAVLGAAGAFTEAIRVTGVGNDRAFGWRVSGTFVGTLSLQRSLVGPDAGFTVVATATGTGTFDNDDSGTLNNVIAWYRVGFAAAADYTSGNATVFFGQTSAGGSVKVPDPAHGAASGSGGRYGTCRVTGWTSPTQVSIEVIDDFSTLTPTKLWQESIWSPAQGWPTSVTQQESRLWWFSGGLVPIVGSQSSNYTGFAEQDVLGNGLGDAAAILEGFGEGPADRVNWALGLSRLLCGREMSIASLRSSTFDTPLTPTDTVIKDCSQQGAARLPAIKVGKRGVFVQQAGNRVYELFFNPQAADYDDKDLTRFNTDIGKPGFVGIAKAAQPDTTIYFVRGDGEVACLLYDPNDDVEAWWRLMTLGVIENVRVLPRAAGGDDLVYFVVRRVINGVTKRFLERLTQRSNNLGGTMNLLLDAHASYSGAPVTSITLAHLPNTTVTVWADGAAIGSGTTNGSGVLSPLPDNTAHSVIVAGLAGATVSYAGAPATSMTGLAAYNNIPGEFFADQQPSGRMRYVGTLTPSGGAVSLPNGWQATAIVGFFGYMAPLMTAKLAYGAQLGSALAQKKKIDHLGLVTYDMHAQGLQHGQRFDVLDTLPLVEDDGDVDAATVWGEYDQPVIETPGEWDTDARLCLLGQAPYPCTLGGVIVAVNTHEK